ncbi:MAG TPA: SCP2 sterol-binding domain-containing protein [Azospirillaceae bacterium]|nr:SCP2 sterol-binding domain-containing protein [Azospirillaceae bacterium]
MSISANELVDEMRARAGDLKSLNARVRFALGDEGEIWLDATGGAVKVSADAPPSDEPDCTLRLSADNLAKLMQGKLNPMLAFSLGKLKVDGSKGVAMKLAGLLDA